MSEPQTVLLAPGLGGLRRVLEGSYRVLDLPAEDLSGFLSGEGAAAQALVTTGSRPVSPVLAASPNFKLVAVIGSGYEGIDVAALGGHGVSVTHTPSANHEDVADHALGLLIAVVRKIVAGDQVIRAGEWVPNRHQPPTRSLRTMRMGIVGLGAIGLAIAERLEPFGCTISWWGPRDKPNAKYRRADTLLALAADSDALLVAHRADASNIGLIDRAVLDALGPKGVLVNVARGSAVDEDAMIEGLRSGRLGGAGLDVFDIEPTPAERWRDVPNVVLTPHTAGGGDASMSAMVGMVVENLRRHFSGEPLAHPVALRP